MSNLTDNERELINELAEWIATAPRDMILIMYGMMLSDSREVA